MSRKKTILRDLEITGIADRGRGVARPPSGKVVFVEKVALGDVADVLIWKKKRDYMEGSPLRFTRLSADRTEPFCSHFGVCGGCKWQHVEYDTHLRYKESIVANALQRIGKLQAGSFLPIIGAEKTRFYRNKIEFSFSNRKWLTREQIDSGEDFDRRALGFHPPGAFDKIVDIDHCYLQGDPSNELRLFLKDLAIQQELEFWDAREKTGFIRDIMIRITTMGQLMLIVSFSTDDQDRIRAYLDAVREAFPQLTALFYCINDKLNDYIYDLDMHLYSGTPYVEEKLGDLVFRIGPKSFFQTNTYQAKVLYDLVVEFAGLTGSENVYDLYTGLGSIAQYVAGSAGSVVGIEEVEAAIADAFENTRLNGIGNCTFYAGDVKDILTDAFVEKHGSPDLVITDPPRAGMHPQVVNTLIKLAAPRIVYVSCNPATQARDLQLLGEMYSLEKIQPVDMFPFTHHIESVALLERK